MYAEINKEWYVRSDAYNIVLCRKQIVKEGKTAGEETEISEGYYRTLDMALAGYFDKRVKISDANGWREVADLIREVRDEIAKIRKEVTP